MKAPTSTIPFSSDKSNQTASAEIRIQGLLAATSLIAIMLLLLWLMNVSTSASNPVPKFKAPLARLSERVSVQAAGRGNPWISLADGRDIITPFSGPPNLVEALESNQVKPLSLASADFDEDGVIDLISGYSSSHGGIVTLMRGNVDTIYQNMPESQQRKAEGTYTDSPFLGPAFVFALPESADFIGAGDFDGDSHWDLIAAARGSDKLNFLSGNGRGGFSPAKPVYLSGGVTAMIVGEINRRDGLNDVVVGVSGFNGPKVLVFEGSEGALWNEPEEISVSTDVTSLALGQLDDEPNYDLAIASGHELIIIHGRDRNSLPGSNHHSDVPYAVEQRAFPSEIKSISIGGFTGSQCNEIALLFQDGQIEVLTDPSKSRDIRVTRLESLRTTSIESNSPREPADLSTSLQDSIRDSTTRKKSDHDSFRPIETWNERTLLKSEEIRNAHLICARISSVPVDNLLIMGASTKELKIVVAGRSSEKNEQSVDISIKTFETIEVVLNDRENTAAVLPMRLNKDALNDLVVLKTGSTMPVVVETRPQSILTVTNTNDSGDGSLRDLITRTNSNPGADEIRFGISGSGTHTISLVTPLPAITGALTIDGYTQPGTTPNSSVTGNNAVLLIEVNGANASATSGFNLSAGNCVLRGLVINRFFFAGIDMDTHGFNLIEGNFIGTNSSGTFSLGNKADGIGIFGSPENVIGGTIPSARNLLSGNNANGIYIFGAESVRVRVQGNYIGTAASGITKLGNGGNGIRLENTASNTIGGPNASASNVISGNAGPDSNRFVGNGIILINSRQYLIQNNSIGTDANGILNLGNSRNGIVIDRTSNDGTVRDVVAAHNGRVGIAQEAFSTAIIRPNVRLFSNALGGLVLFEGIAFFKISQFRIYSVSISGVNLTVSGFLFANQDPNSSAIVDFYSGAASGSGQQFVGALPIYLGARTVVTDSSGIANFKFDFPLPPGSNGHYVNAQATDDHITFFDSNFLQIGTSCSYAVTPASSNLIPSSGGTSSFQIQTQGNCEWTLGGDLRIIADINETAGIGNKVINYAVSPNPTPNIRTAIFIVEGQSHRVTQAAATECFSVPINIGQTVTATISDSDCNNLLSPGKSDFYTFNASAGQIVTIIMNNTSSIDPSIWLFGPNGAFAIDDNSGGGVNARIDYPIIHSGTYSIEATVADRFHRGSYSILVTLNGGCSVAPINIGQTLNGTLTDGDCTGPRRTGSKADFYTFNGNAGQTITITMSKNLLPDPYLALLGPGSDFTDLRDFHDDIIPGVLLDSQLTHTLPVSGTYTITATAFEPDQRGSYSISVTNFNRNAQFITQNTSTQVVAGSRFHHLIRMRNTGSTTWAAFNGFRIGSQNPADNVIWGRDRFGIQSPVSPGGQDTIDLLLIAPEVAGTYNLSWRLVQEMQSSTYFGNATLSLTINVVPSAVDTDNDGIPNNLESQDGRNPNVKDNDVYGNNLLFVKQMYRDFLGHEGLRGPNDIDFWVGALNRGVTRAEIVADFFTLPEFITNTTVVVKMFDICFKRSPDYEAIRFWLDESTSGRRNGEGIANGLLTSNEFLDLHPNLTDEDFVELMYRNSLNRRPTFAERSQRLNELSRGASRGSILLDIAANSTEYNDLVINKVQILEMYLAMLRRIPTTSEFNIWITAWSTAVSEARQKQKRIDMANAVLGGTDLTINLPYTYRKRFLLNSVVITNVEKIGKNLVITGSGFAAGAKLLVNGVEKKTVNVTATRLTGKKAAKGIQTGATIQIRNLDGSLSNEWKYQ